jgi:uncharacterized membrane protein
MRIEGPLEIVGGYIEFSGRNTPDVSPAGKGRLHYDKGDGTFKLSVDGGAYGAEAGGLAVGTTAGTVAAGDDSRLTSLGDAANLDVGTTAGTVAAGDDARFTTITANNKVDDYTLLLADAGKVIEMNKGTAVTLTVPLNATAAFAIGTVIEVWQQGAGQVTVAAAVGVTIRSAGGLLALAGQYSGAVLRKVGTNEWALTGDLA